MLRWFWYSTVSQRDTGVYTSSGSYLKMFADCSAHYPCLPPKLDITKMKRSEVVDELVNLGCSGSLSINIRSPNDVSSSTDRVSSSPTTASSRTKVKSSETRIPAQFESEYKRVL